MNAPPKTLSRDEFNNFLVKHLNNCYEKKLGGSSTDFVCKLCGTDVEKTTGFALIHFSDFGGVCCGVGEVQEFDLPYCPECEGPPRLKVTCVHVQVLTDNCVRH
mgnify:FL=1